MNNELLELLDIIRKWHRNPEKISRRAAESRTPLVKLPPQITWTLLGLIHYRLRKGWAYSTLKKQLPTIVAEQNRNDMVSIEDILDGNSRGVLPGKPEWEYELDGNLSYLTNKVTGEQLHIDVVNGPADIFAHHFPEFLRSIRKPSPVVQRLLELFPHGQGVMPAIEYLRDMRCFHVIDECDGWMDFELCGVVNRYQASVREFLLAWRRKQNQPTLGAIIGDWDTVRVAAKVPKAEHYAKVSRQRWLSLLHFNAGGGLDDDLLYALRAADDDQLPTYLAQALDDPILAATAIDIIDDDPAWKQEVEGALDRTLGHKFAPEKIAAASYLARIGSDVDPLIDRLLSPPRNIKGAILLSLDYAPQRLFDLLEKGLRSRHRDDRLTAAAILAHLDTPESRQMLLDALESSTDQDVTIECRAALRETGDTNAHAAADAWEADHPDCNAHVLHTSRGLYRLDGGCGRVLCTEIAELAERIAHWRHLDHFGHTAAQKGGKPHERPVKSHSP